MAKKVLKKYSAVATIFYSQEAVAGFTIMAESDDAAIRALRKIVSGRGIVDEADYIEDVDTWSNVSGNFRLARGDEVPDDESDSAIVVEREDFENEK